MGATSAGFCADLGGVTLVDCRIAVVSVLIKKFRVAMVESSYFDCYQGNSHGNCLPLS